MAGSAPQLARLLAAAALAAAVVPAFAQPTATQPAAPAASPELALPPGSDLGRLQDLMRAAPGRQVGQPGNDAVDKMVAERFAAAAEATNKRLDAGRVAQAETLRTQADSSEERR